MAEDTPTADEITAHMVACGHAVLQIDGIKAGTDYYNLADGYTQAEINDFIKKCKDSENANGYLTENFFELNTNKSYKFSSGPFVEKIFKIIDLQKNKINILLGNIKTTINRKKLIIRPV